MIATSAPNRGLKEQGWAMGVPGLRCSGGRCAGRLAEPLPLSEGDLARVRQKRGELFALWEAVKPGDALELPFDVS